MSKKSRLQLTREDLIECILYEISSEEARKLPLHKRREYASDNTVRPAGTSKRKGTSVKLANRRQRNKARGYFRRTIGQMAAERAVEKNS